MIITTGTTLTQYWGTYALNLYLPQGIDVYGWTDYIYSGTVQPYTSDLFLTVGNKLNELFKPADWESRLYSLMLSLRENGLPRRKLISYFNADKLVIPNNANLVAIIINNDLYQDINWVDNQAQLDDYTVSLEDHMVYLSSEAAKLGMIVEYDLVGSEDFWIEYLATKLNLELVLSSEYALLDTIYLGSIKMILGIRDYIKSLEARLDSLEGELR